MLAAAQSPDYLAEMPAANTVVEDMKGRTDRESAARASIALNALAAVIRSPFDASAAKRPLRPLEQAKLTEYTRASAAARAAEWAKVDHRCEGNDCDMYLLPRCEQGYAMSAALYRELLDRYFSPQWLTRNGERLKGTLWQEAQRLPAGTRAMQTLPATASEACTASPSLLGKWSPSGLTGRLRQSADDLGAGRWALISALLLPVAILSPD
jgi:hypothetical protein